MTDIPNLPPPLRGEEPNTWANSTILERFPAILQRTIDNNTLSADAEEKLQALQAEIPEGPLRLLQDPSSPDEKDWNGYIAPHQGKNWLEVPWFFVEHYLYRRIMESVRYFQSGFDPFLYEKNRGLNHSLAGARQLAKTISRWRKQGLTREHLKRMITIDLWGNQADLSLWPSGEENNPNHQDLDAAQAHILADDTPALLTWFSALETRSARVDFLLDNAGFELVADLFTADVLLSGGWAERVTLHLKAHPTFVSDAVVGDVDRTIQALIHDPDPGLQETGKRLGSYREDQTIRCLPHFYWNSPLMFWELPDPLRQKLEGADLVLSKGDAHYRRLLGDRHWPYTTPFQTILSHFDAPLLALRTLKAEVAAGIPQKEIQRARAADPDWMVNGRWGLMQLARN